MRKIFLIIPLFFWACSSGQGGANRTTPNPVVPNQTSPLTTQLRTYTQEEELVAYLQAAKDRSPQFSSPESEASPSSADAAGGNQSITNNQESGADEGGLVKNFGNYLVILRQGKLFTTLVSYEGMSFGPNVDPVPLPSKMDDIEVKQEGLDDNVWYDELLMKGNQAIVIGYRYSLPNSYWHGVSEINIFEIGAEGQISRKGTYFIESGDYYSWQNYASRLVDGQLVLYAPYYGNLLLTDQNTLQFPKLLSWQNGSVHEVRTLMTAADVTVPEDVINYPTLHTMHVCSFDNGFTCKSRGVLGGWQSEHYVTENRFYLWVGRQYPIYGWCGTTLDGVVPALDVNADRNPPAADSNLLYAFDIKGNGAGVTQVWGSPMDQFSFDETANGIDFLSYKPSESNIHQGGGAYPSIYYTPDYRLAHIPPTHFGSTSSEIVESDYHVLTGDFFATDSYALLHRFTDKELILGHDNKVAVIKRDTHAMSTLEIPGSQRGYLVQMTRLEKAGDRMLIVGQDPYMSPMDGPSALFMQMVNLGEVPSLGGHLVIEGYQEAEIRSHGYLYEDKTQGDDLIGLATQSVVSADRVVSSDEVSSWMPPATSVHILRVSQNGNLSLAGNFHSEVSPEVSECTTSCVDWYGNTRPIFLNDSIYGLMGNQLSLGGLNQDGSLWVQRSIEIQEGGELP